MVSTTVNQLPLLNPDWPAPQNVFAFTTTRDGGCSKPPFNWLNVGDHVGDNPDCVAYNRSRLPFSGSIQWLEQVHSNRVVEFSGPENRHAADAIIANQINQFCAVMTADCIPLLICNDQGNEVAAVHAGWKGLDSNIIDKTITKMRSKPSELMAWIGPGICANCYEVGEDLYNKFVKYYSFACNCENPETGLTAKFTLDLAAIARFQLTTVGVERVFLSGQCTYCCPEKYFSFRWATHQKHRETGRIASVIGIRSP